MKEKEQNTCHLLWALIALKNALSSHSTIFLLLAWVNRMTRVTSKTRGTKVTRVTLVTKVTTMTYLTSVTCITRNAGWLR